MTITQHSSQSQHTDQSESTEVVARDPYGIEEVQSPDKWIVAQDNVNLPACRHGSEPDFSDPLKMASESSAADTRPKADSDAPNGNFGSGGLSQLLSNILEQLSISAWLPAAMLVGNVAVLLQLHSNRSINIADAIKDLTGKPLGTVIVLAFSLLLTTIITQAFEFEVIRLLEGYFDSPRRMIQACLALRIRRHEVKRQRLQVKLQQAERAAFMQAREIMLSEPRPYDRSVLDLIEDNVFHRTPRKVTRAVAKMVDQIDWKARLPSHTLYRIDSIRARLDAYPVSNRIMPTRLGNLLRAFEDKLPLAPDEDLQGFVIRRYDDMPPALKAEHKEHRSRLDMYCSLVLVFAALAMLGFGLLIEAVPLWGVGSFAVAYCVMSYVCYEAAIATGRGYGQVLLQITEMDEEE